MSNALSTWPALLVLLGALSGCGDDHREQRLREAGAHPSFERLMQVASAKAGADKFRQCAACHSIIEGAIDRGGPNLFGVFGKRPGTNSSRFGYTAALKESGGTWTARRLNAWMIRPASVVPGTSMQFSGVPDPLDRVDIIAYLRSQTPAH